MIYRDDENSPDWMVKHDLASPDIDKIKPEEEHYCPPQCDSFFFSQALTHTHWLICTHVTLNISFLAKWAVWTVLLLRRRFRTERKFKDLVDIQGSDLSAVWRIITDIQHTHTSRFKVPPLVLLSCLHRKWQSKICQLGFYNNWIFLTTLQHIHKILMDRVIKTLR